MANMSKNELYPLMEQTFPKKLQIKNLKNQGQNSGEFFKRHNSNKSESNRSSRDMKLKSPLSALQKTPGLIPSSLIHKKDSSAVTVKSKHDSQALLKNQNTKKSITNGSHMNYNTNTFQSDESEGAKFRSCDKEAQSKNLKNFKKVLKAKKREKKERKKQEKDDSCKRKNKVNSINTKKSSRIINQGLLKRSRAITKKNSIMTSDQKRTTMSEDDYDSQEDEFKKVERDLRRSLYTFYPDGKFKSIWDMISFIQIVFWSLYLPFDLSFRDGMPNTPVLHIFNNISVVFFMVDVVINFNVGFFWRGILIMERHKIIVKYLSTWFFCDLIASLPYEWIISLIQSQTNIMVQDMIVNDITYAIMKFTKLMVVIFFVAHWMACLFFFVAHKEMQFSPDTWITDAGVQDASMSLLYVDALYWSITTMASVGYGDFGPKTTQERIAVIFIMIISSGVYAYTINDIGKLVQNYNVLAGQYKEKMIYVTQFMIQKGLPKELREKINRYLNYNWDLKKMIKIEEEELMGLLNNDLRDQIKSQMTGRILLEVDLFSKNFSVEFLSQMTHIFKKKSYAVDDNIIFEDQIGDEIFFTINGRVAIIHKKSNTYIKDLYKDSYFGEISFFGDIPRTCSAKSRDFTDVYAIKKADFLEVADHFTEAIVMYNKIKDSLYMGQKNYKFLNLKCYLCERRRDHISIDCSLFKNIAGNMKQYYMKLHGKELKKKEKKRRKKMQPNQRMSSIVEKLTEKEEQTDEEFDPPIYFKHNLTAPRQSLRNTLYQKNENSSSTSRESSNDDNNQDKTQSIHNQEQEEKEQISEFEVTQEEQLNVGEDVGHEENTSRMHQHNVLEDIEENQSLEVSGSGSDDNMDKILTPKEKRSSTMILQNKLKRASTKITPIDIKHKISKNKISSGNTTKRSLINSNNSGKNNAGRVKIQNLITQIQQNCDSSVSKTDDKEVEMKKQENGVVPLVKSIKKTKYDRLVKNENRIRPFRGIRKNVVNRKIKFVSGRLFTEDMEEELQDIEEQGVNPIVIKNWNPCLDQTTDPYGFHTMISLTSSTENLINGKLLQMLQEKQRKLKAQIQKKSSQKSCKCQCACSSASLKSVIKSYQKHKSNLEMNEDTSKFFKQKKKLTKQFSINKEQSDSLNNQIKQINFASNFQKPLPCRQKSQVQARHSYEGLYDNND